MKFSRRWLQVSVREALLIVACCGTLCAWYREHCRCERMRYFCGAYRACMDRAEEGGEGGYDHSWLYNKSMVSFSVTVAPFDKKHFPNYEGAR